MLRIICTLFFTGLLLTTLAEAKTPAKNSAIRLSGHVPQTQIARSNDLGRASPTAMMRLAIPLRAKNEAELKSFVDHVSTPGDPLHGKFLTRAGFVKRFAPTTKEYAKIAKALSRMGFQVSATHANRLLIEVQAPVATVETALQTEIHKFRDTHGTMALAPISEPTVSRMLASRIQGIVGLSTFHTRHAHFKRAAEATVSVGYTPAVIRSAYNLSELSQTGAGQTVALVEFDGFTMSDITSYASQYNLGTPKVQTVLINGFNGVPSSGADSGAVEVTLDIEMILALAPATKIVVYEASPDESDSGMLALLNQIASDNSAQVISNSWGDAEDQMVAATLQSENTIFMEFAAQGQSSFVASGDNGADDDGTKLSVDDPGSQPYSVAVGGTSLTVNADGTYKNETTWNGGSIDNGASGGGISSVWPQPSFQNGLATSANLGSTTMRMVPDVSLNSDPKNGYAIFFEGQLQNGGGGTSYASPLWAGFTALVNERRSTAGLSPLGFPLPLIYQVAQGSLYVTAFHDIADLSTNLVYPATPSYDLATGWGSYSAGALFAALTSAAGLR